MPSASSEVKAQAVSYTTGVPAMIGAMMMLTGKWHGEGVFNMEQFDPDPFMDEAEPATACRGRSSRARRSIIEYEVAQASQLVNNGRNMPWRCVESDRFKGETAMRILQIVGFVLGLVAFFGAAYYTGHQMGDTYGRSAWHA